ncbi:receptor kinase-like protein Xa21 [Capsicum chacoense]
MVGSLPPVIGNLKAITKMDLSMNKFSNGIPREIGGLKNLAHLSLRHNKLQGAIPDSMSKMVGLEFLNLSHTNIFGIIPKSLEKLQNLKYFNVPVNKLYCEIPSGGPFKNLSSQFFIHNEALCGSSRFSVPPCPTSSKHRSNRKKLLVLFLLLTMAVVFVPTTFFLLWIRHRRGKRAPPQAESLSTETRERISYNELLQVTDGLSESNLIGCGSFSFVYKGILRSGTAIAVKVFNLQLNATFKSFDMECEVLCNLRHRNLIKVITSCSNLDFKALLLEYMPNGSLEKYFYSHNNFLDIMQRLSIMIDVACALEYLHHGCSPPVIHCDLKPSNVLLDDDMVAHLRDFGISKLLGEDESDLYTKTLATLSYIAPEYGQDGSVSTKCDVYSYGIMLLETFTRRKPSEFEGDHSLKHCDERNSFPRPQIASTSSLYQFDCFLQHHKHLTIYVVILAVIFASRGLRCRTVSFLMDNGAPMYLNEAQHSHIQEELGYCFWYGHLPLQNRPYHTSTIAHLCNSASIHKRYGNKMQYCRIVLVFIRGTYIF